MRRASKADANQEDIVKGLRATGCFVQSIHRLGQGVSDLLVGYRGKWFVMELKDGAKAVNKQKLTEDEIRWIMEIRNRAPVYVVTSLERAIRIVRE